MSGNTFGHVFRVTTFGESHGPAVGAIVDGCPPRLALSEADIQPELDRRKPGTGRLVSARSEEDRVEILSGVAEGLTTGTPIALLVRNKDAKPGDYRDMARVYRPGHADLTYDQKYGHRAVSGGGRASARETVARVAASAIAKKLLHESFGTQIVGWVDEVGSICAEVDPATVTRPDVAGEIQCPDPEAGPKMADLIAHAKEDADSVGGVIGCVARQIPAGLGDPVFAKLDARLASAMLGIPAAKGFEMGSGFAGARMRGSEHNDPFVPAGDGRVTTTTNHSGGVLGGISNGMPVWFRVAFKPVSTIGKPQATVDQDGRPATVQGKGRHDPCVLPRAVVIVEAMAALVLCDAWLRHRGQVGEG